MAYRLILTCWHILAKWLILAYWQFIRATHLKCPFLKKLSCDLILGEFYMLAWSNIFATFVSQDVTIEVSMCLLQVSITNGRRIGVYASDVLGVESECGTVNKVWLRFGRFCVLQLMSG